MAPIAYPNSYINRHGIHSVLLQGICNERMEFIHTYIGEPGSMREAKLLKRSKFKNLIKSGKYIKYFVIPLISLILYFN